MNVSAHPPIKPPSTYDGNITTTRPMGAGGKKPGPVDGVPLPPTNDAKPTEPMPPCTCDPRGAAPTDAPEDMFNLEGLLADWGKKDSMYDLDANGNVDGWDLALFLGGDRPKAEEPTYNVDGLLDQWGQSDSPYDLDGNGNVDGWDLSLFLGGQRPGDETSGTNNINDPSNVNGAAGAGAPQASNALDRPERTPEQRLLNQIISRVFRESGIGRAPEYSLENMQVDGRLASALDPDGDGMVKRRDLIDMMRTQVGHAMQTDENFNAAKWTEQWISNLTAPVSAANDALVSVPGENVAAPETKTDSQREASLTRFSAYVGDKFQRAGFDKHPPRNLHAVLSNFNLTGADRSFMLKQLAERYPDGLGINAVG